ncbi:sunset domain-containing protein [Enteractinococcus helveticum]|uniref:sunset domain-containing protein n=1 Tax=Enteractinococcus helveticum TaxID=1837282 RepID=UPI000B33A779|nr:hypothetical protein [Enteractinococcus helveticum]
MKLTPLKFRRAFAGVALIGAITVSGFVPANAAELAVPETTSSVTTETPAVGTVETLTAAITGTPQVGATLTADTNAEDGSTFEWLRDGVAIPAAIASVYVPTNDDICSTLAVRVSPPAGSGQEPVTSASTEPISFPASAVQQPTVSGSNVVGKALSAQSTGWPTGTTVSYQWLLNGTPISGATSSRYTLQAADQGKRVTVQVTGEITNCFSHQVTSSATAVSNVLGAPLAATTPVIKGTPKVGNTLTAQTGAWTKGTKLTYQWLRNGKAISKATGATYKPVAADVGKNISVKVTGSKAGHETISKASKALSKTVAGTLRSSTPKISGTAKVGKTLKITHGSWTSGTSFSYQWLRNGKAISKATKKTYTPVAADVGKRISVKVTGKKSGYKSVAKTSAKKAKTAVGTLSAPRPKVSGTPKVGHTVTAQTGTWTKGTKLTYQWLRNGKAISKATKKTYKPVAADVGKQLSVKVTGKKSGYKSVSKTSPKRAKTTRGTLTGARPKVTGTTTVGKTLKVTRGKWTSGTTFSYQWLRNGKAISGAKKSQYKLTSADRGKKISVRVTGKRSGYSTLNRTSAQVGPIKGTTSSSNSKTSSSSNKVKATGKSCPASHPIKGNRPTDGTDWKYHVRGGAFYNVTVPEECFKTTTAARAAGYRASKR